MGQRNGGGAWLLILWLALLGGGQSSVGAAAAAGQGSCWTAYQVQTPGGIVQARELRGIVVVSANDAWSVGYSGSGPGNGQATRTLAAHWNGTTWQQATTPNPAQNVDWLNAVSATSSNDIWAVGAYGENALRTLVMHWDGRAWSTVPSPNLVSANNELQAVTAVASDDVWAMGYANVTLYVAQVTVMHWDGKAWTLLPNPYTATGLDFVRSMHAFSRNDIWAVGRRNDGPLTMHWDGKAWTPVPNPATGTLSNLDALGGAGPNDIWAVGGAIVEHWDGKAWSIVPSPEGVSLRGVITTTASDVMAVGTTGGEGNESGAGIHWDGQQWDRSPEAESMPGGRVLAVDRSPRGDLWVAGASSAGGGPTVGLLARRVPSLCPAQGPGSAFSGGPLSAPVTVPGSGSRLFPQTGKSVSGLFLRYWDEHGGLRQFGYPLSPPVGEVSELDGKMYTVQYFERAMFEYHPEYAGTPGEVLPAQLGTLQYRSKYPGGAAKQKPSTVAGAVFFAQTGHRIGGAFLGYWQAHESLAQNGYPLTDEFEERSSLDGKMYTVQYFERVVFEAHPQNTPPYNVLLTQLGRARFADRYGAQGSNPRPRLVASGILNGPLIVGHYMLWQTITYDKPVYALDLRTNNRFTVQIGQYGFQSHNDFFVEGNRLLWVENGGLVGYDLEARKPLPSLATIPQHDKTRSTVGGGVAYSDGVLYYADQGFDGSGNTLEGSLYALDTRTGADRKIAEHGQNPIAQDGVLLWEDARNDESVTPEFHVHRLHAMRLDGSMRDIVIAPNGYSSYTVLAGGIVLWFNTGDHFDGTGNLHAMKLDGSLPDTVIASGNEAHSYLAKDYLASGDNIVWGGGSLEPEGTVFVYNIRTRRKKAISGPGALPPILSGNTVVWTEHKPAMQGRGSDPGASVDGWYLQKYDLGTSASSTILQRRTTLLNIVGIVENKLVLNSGGLYLMGANGLN